MILENPVAAFMYKTSPEVAEKPKRLFHATPLKNYARIKDQGIVPHAVFGQTYFCEKEKQCLKFVQKPCIIFEVDMKQIDMEFLRLSLDHNKAVYKFECFTYYQDIPATAIKNWRVHT
jgi:hypothetical protein